MGSLIVPIKMELIIFISRIRVKRLGMIPGKSGVATSRYPDRDFKVQGYIKGMDSLIDPSIY